MKPDSVWDGQPIFFVTGDSGGFDDGKEDWREIPRERLVEAKDVGKDGTEFTQFPELTEHGGEPMIQMMTMNQQGELSMLEYLQAKYPQGNKSPNVSGANRDHRLHAVRMFTIGRVEPPIDS